jgi:phosphoglycolate phosphatase-like HAD superfamily hydrolase
MSRFTTILWDVDGTLLDFEYSQRASLAKCFQTIGREIAEEIQDLYDIDRKPTGEQFYRGDPVPSGRYRLGVQVWVRNDDGKFLLSQRHPCQAAAHSYLPHGGRQPL